MAVQARSLAVGVLSLALSAIELSSAARAQQAPSVPSTVPNSDNSNSGAAPPSPRHLLPLPAEEDWSFLADPTQRTDPFDPIKYIPFGTGGGYLSLGGEARAYYESYRNEGFGQFPGTSSYLEQRYQVHADLHPLPGWRVFVELQSEQIGNRPGGPRLTLDKDSADLAEGFVEWTSSTSDPMLHAPDYTLRIGRQEFDFGAGRLISAREGPLGEGPNVLQAFDAVRGIWRDGPWRLDLFAGRPLNDKTGAFDDTPFSNQALWGAYLTHGGPPGAPVPGFDLYYIGTERPDAPFFSGAGNERRQTVGARAYKTGAPYDYDIEAFYQFGTIGTRDIRAWSVSGQGGYTLESLPWTPRLGVGLAFNSGGGDSSTSRDVYAPFPRGYYFGNIASIGPENLTAAEIALTLHPTDTITLGAQVYDYWRTDLSDGIYNLGGYPLVAPTNRARYVGYQPGVSASWQVTSHLSLNADYETLQRGDFLKQAPGAKPINYFATWVTFRF